MVIFHKSVIINVEHLAIWQNLQDFLISDLVNVSESLPQGSAYWNYYWINHIWKRITPARECVLKWVNWKASSKFSGITPAGECVLKFNGNCKYTALESSYWKPGILWRTVTWESLPYGSAYWNKASAMFMQKLLVCIFFNLINYLLCIDDLFA